MDFGVFTSADIGRTVSVSSETTGFNVFSSLLTNGTDDQFMVWSLLTWNTLPGYTPGSGMQDAESRWFQANGQKFVNTPYPDFYGYEITRIDLTINSLNIWVSSYQDPITTSWTTNTEFSYDATYTVPRNSRTSDFTTAWNWRIICKKIQKIIYYWKGQAMNYWVVGATWDEENLAEMFYRRGYWEMGYKDTDKPRYASRRNEIKTGDRIAVKTRDGKAAKTICIKAIGIVKDIDKGRVYIDWIIKGLKDRHVPLKGCVGTIYGPFSSNDTWTWQVFCL